MVVSSPIHSDSDNYGITEDIQGSQFDSSDHEADFNDPMDEDICGEEDVFIVTPLVDSGSSSTEDYELDEEPSKATDFENVFRF